MAIYRNKYTLEFDDVIEGEFNDYKLEILKKYEIDSLNTGSNVYITSYNANQGLIYQGTPVYIEGTIIKRSFGSGASTMPAIGVAYEDITQGSNGIILTKGMMAYATAYGDQDVWVGSTGGLVLAEPSSGIVQKIGYKSGTGTGSFLVLLDQEITLTGTNIPVVVNYNLTKDNIFAPIRSSYLDISIYHMDDMANDQFFDLYITQDDGFKVKLYKNNNLFWDGWLGSSLVAEEQISSPYRVKLRAYDGLHLLKKTPYFDTTEVFQATANQFNDRYGYHEVKDIITKCLFNTGLIGNPTNQIISLIKIKNDDSSGTTLANDYFLEDTKMHHTTFLNGESDGMNCFQVLEMTLDSLGATIYQRDGNWCIVRISDITQFSKNSSPTCRRDFFWVNVTNPITINKTTSSTAYSQASTYYTEDTQFFQIDGASTMTFQYPMKQVIIKQENDHDFITSNQLDSVNDLGASDPSGTLLFDEWQPLFGNSGLGIQEAVVLRDENYKNANASLTPRNDRNLGKALIEADAGTDGVTWRNKQPSLKYPVSHKTIKKQYDWNEFVENDAQGNPKYNWYTSGHVFTLKFRPLKENSLATDNYIRVPFTLRMKADNTGTLGAYDLTTGRGTGNQLSETVAFFASRFDDTGNLFRPFCQDTRKINEWQTVKLHVAEHALELDASALVGVTESCELESRIYGGFLWIEDVSSSGATFTDRYDVTYTDIKASPTVTKWKIEPKNQEYIVEQSSNYSRVESYDVKLGSNICTTGKNCFIGFQHGTNNALLSFDNWQIVFKTSNTIQHIVALGHMILYRIPIRRMDGTHYGNYKYGNKMVYDSGVNGSSGKFFPMGVQMDLRNARTTFSGDDLMDNFGFSLSSISRKIKWMGENDISETIDY